MAANGNHRFACRRHVSRIELVATDAGKPDNVSDLYLSNIEKKQAIGEGE
jgi:hypothetical protein